MSKRLRSLPILFALCALSTACALPGDLASEADPEGAPDGQFAPPFTPPPAAGKEDSAAVTAIAAEINYYSTQVWETRNAWEDRNTVEANRAGLAWPANSGLNWEEKYRAWVKGMRRIRAQDGWYDTFEITTPYGKTLPAPALECAESALFLRSIFASWYALPFYMEATDSSGRRVFLGHFGFRTLSGPYAGAPAFKTAYRDYSGLDLARNPWPADAALAGKKLAGGDDDFQPFISSTARFGAYADALLLNKRVGHYLVWLLDWFGSMNLASGVNTYNVKPAALTEGDILVERWQRSGVGHTLIVKNVEKLPDGKLAGDVASGSMPRRQPKWDESVLAKSYFTSPYTGGSALGPDGSSYASYGGGLKRFRTAKRVNGYWQNAMLAQDAGNWINSTNLTATGARPTQFQTLLGSPDPAALRDALLRGIEDKRNVLRHNPASCSAREVREQLFRQLYTLCANNFGMAKEDVDRQYRNEEDYVFAELIYTKSKTCCWNSTNADMYKIIADYAASVKSTATCNPPPVFRASSGGYAAFKSFAVSTGRGALWKDWTEDESCPQRTVAEDTEATHDGTPYCSLYGPPCVDDAFAPNQSAGSARALGAGSYANLQICARADDYFKVSLAAGQTLSITIHFTHASGDLDLKIQDASGAVVASSTGTTDVEAASVTASTAAAYTVHVYGYNGAHNPYSMDVVVR